LEEMQLVKLDLLLRLRHRRVVGANWCFSERFHGQYQGNTEGSGHGAAKAACVWLAGLIADRSWDCFNLSIFVLLMLVDVHNVELMVTRVPINTRAVRQDISRNCNEPFLNGKF
jgi:hypothetical protein